MKVIAYRHHGLNKGQYFFSLPFMGVSIIAIILVISIVWGGYKTDLRIWESMRYEEESYAAINPYYHPSEKPLAPVSELAISLSICFSVLAVFSFVFFHTLYVDKTTPLHTIYLENDIYYVYKRKIRGYVKIPEDRILSFDHSKTVQSRFVFNPNMDISKYFGRLTETQEVRLPCGYMTVTYYDDNNKIRKIRTQSYTGPVKEK